MEIELDQLRFRIEALEAVLVALDKNIGENLIQFLRQTQKTEGISLHDHIEAGRAIEEITAVLNVMLPHRESTLPNVTEQFPTRRQNTATLSVIGLSSIPID
jgi:hypothetical protein